MHHGDPHEKGRRVRRTLDDAARPEENHAKQERNAGLAIAVAAIVVLLLMLAIASGVTGAFGP